MQLVAVIDYGMGNLYSVVRALRHEAPADTRIELTDDPAKIQEADRLVFPGQGAARDAMTALKHRGLDRLVISLATQRPFLGICLGQQILLDWSAENGGVDLLGIVSGTVQRFPDNTVDSRGHRLKIPHMGWNVLRKRQDHPLLQGLSDQPWFYFVHSYFVVPTESDVIVAETDYGSLFASVVARGSLFALQCHPEKSAHDGLQLLHNFLRWDGKR